jgi:hypothetical protein
MEEGWPIRYNQGKCFRTELTIIKQGNNMSHPSSRPKKVLPEIILSSVLCGLLLANSCGVGGSGASFALSGAAKATVPVVFTQRNGRLVITGVVPGCLADKAGLRQLDEVLEIDGIRTDARSPGEIKELLYGPLHTSVRITVSRDNQTMELLIPREHMSASDVAQYFRQALEKIQTAPRAPFHDPAGDFRHLADDAMEFDQIELGLQIAELADRSYIKANGERDPFRITYLEMVARGCMNTHDFARLKKVCATALSSVDLLATQSMGDVENYARYASNAGDHATAAECYGFLLDYVGRKWGQDSVEYARWKKHCEPLQAAELAAAEKQAPLKK